MLDPSKKQIGQAFYVVGFKRDMSIRTKQFEIERALTPLMAVPTANTNLPDDFNPQAPRVTAQSNNVSMHFSQVAAQLTIAVDNGSQKAINVIQESIAKRVIAFQGCVDRVIPVDQQAERGLVLLVNYPVDGAKCTVQDCYSYIQSRFIHVPSFGEPASSNFTVGYKTEDNFYLTLSVSHYEVRESEGAIQGQWIDVSSFPVVESGIELKVDVNTRPMLGNPDYGQEFDFSAALMKKTFDFVEREADTLMGIEK